jgi:hypothetical protein
MDKDYYQKYIKYKLKYINLKNNYLNRNKQIHYGGRNNLLKTKFIGSKNKYKKQVFYEISKLNRIFNINTSIKSINKIDKKLNNKLKKNLLKRPSVEKIDEKQIYKINDIKYDFYKNIKLNERYQNKYIDVLKNSILSKDLYDSGFFEYQFKLRQYLSDCGLNRTTQLYGTCWFNVILNGCIFGDHIRGRIVQLLMNYKNKIGENKMNNLVERIDKTKTKLKSYNKLKDLEKNSIDTNDFNGFEHLIAIFYKILCNEGLRNKEKNKYDNFNLTNLAVSIKMIGTNKRVNASKLEDMAYVAIYGFDILSYLLNKFIDTDSHLKHNDSDKYVFFNENHLNLIFVNIYRNYTNYVGSYYDLNIRNLEIEIDDKDNNINEYIRFNNGVDLININNLDFVVMNYEFSGDKKIPHEIYCIVNNKKTLFKLEFAVLILYLDDKKLSHVINGLICNKDYFLYDSASNNYFHFDWTNLKNNNLSNVLNFYNIYYSGFINVNINVENTSNKFFLLYDEKKRINFKLKYSFAVYYNTEIDFSYDPKICNRIRK